MLVITNCLTDVVDEGCLKVANSLVKRLKEAKSDIEVVSYERQSELTDTYVQVNKFLTNKCIRQACRKHNDVLYLPFPTRKWVMAMRVYLLSKFTKKLRVVLVLKTPVGVLSKLLLKRSGAGIVVFSRDAAEFYGEIVGAQRVTYVNTGVDTQKFFPVSQEQAAQLKRKYGFDPDRKLVLHVGHLNEGRNLRQLLKIPEEYQVLLVTSTLTKDKADLALKQELLSKANIRIMDDYVPQIQELYQLSDVYFFPVAESGHCIDVPLSCMEAAACNKPIVTTRFGEMKALDGVRGVCYLDAFDDQTIQQMISAAVCMDGVKTREAVLAYDWQKTIAEFNEVQ